MKNGVTEAQRIENGIYHTLEVARKLQNITRKQLAEEMNVSGGRVSQMYADKTMSVKQFCMALERLGLKIDICAK